MNITFNLGAATFFLILLSSGESKSLQRNIRSLQKSTNNVQVNHKHKSMISFKESPSCYRYTKCIRFFFTLNQCLFSVFFQMPEPTIIKQCRRINLSFSNSQGLGRKLVRICSKIQNGPAEITTTPTPFIDHRQCLICVLDTGESLFIAFANLLDMIFI